MEQKNERSPCTVISNIITAIILVAVFVVLEIYPIVPAFKRGFYCDDDTINKPYNDKETITTSLLITLTVVLIVGVVITCELMKNFCMTSKHRRLKQPVQLVGSVKVHPVVNCILSRVSLMIVGLFMALIVVDVGKKMVGRLRPHFLAVCQPDYTKFNCSAGYITADVCTNLDLERVAQARLSFPSGHAAVSGFVSLVMALYMEYVVRLPSLLKPLVQFTFLCVGLAGAVTRIPDYYHHWSDVLVGLIIGWLHAVYVVYYLIRLHEEEKVQKEQCDAKVKLNGNSIA